MFRNFLSRPLNHPDFPYFESVIGSIIRRRRFRDWQFEGLKYDNFSQTYLLFLNKEGTTTQIKVLSEWMDRMHDQGDKFFRFRLKKILQDALGIKKDEEGEEEED